MRLADILVLPDPELEQFARHLLTEARVPLPCFICHLPIGPDDSCTWEGPAGRKRPVCASPACQDAVKRVKADLIHEVMTGKVF